MTSMTNNNLLSFDIVIILEIIVHSFIYIYIYLNNEIYIYGDIPMYYNSSYITRRINII